LGNLAGIRAYLGYSAPISKRYGRYGGFWDWLQQVPFPVFAGLLWSLLGEAGGNWSAASSFSPGLSAAFNGAAADKPPKTFCRNSPVWLVRAGTANVHTHEVPAVDQLLKNPLAAVEELPGMR
jgi:hypothetical protein